MITALTQKPEAVLFDWDKTLGDTRDCVVKAMDYVLKLYNLDNWDIIKKQRDKAKSLKDNFPVIFGAKHCEAYRIYLNYYNKYCLKNVKAMPYAVDLLEFLSNCGIKLYIISNKDKVLLEPEVKMTFPDICFAKVLGSQDVERRKPYPDFVFKALEEEGIEINRDNVWLCGDSSVDLECALAAGCLPIMIGNEDFTHNADNYIQFSTFGRMLENIKFNC